MEEDLLEEMMRVQRDLQTDHFKVWPYDLGQLTEEQRALLVKDNTLACLDELHEALNEVGWKPWASSRHVNEDALQGELIDAWHFLMNLFMLAGLTPHMVAERYRAKAQVNQARQAEGYDGVSTKCPGCRRALDDPATSCEPEAKGWWWCSVDKTYYGVS